MSAYLEIKDLRLARGTFSLDIPELSLERGEFFGILGKSGAGKSTLLKLLAGLVSPKTGRIVLNGLDITGLPPHARKIAYLFQSPVLFDHLNVYDNLAMLLKVRKIPRPQRAGLIRTALERTRADQLAERKPGSLSGGEKQRAALAAAIMLEPGLLLLDEPFASLDPCLRVDMRNLVRQLAAERQITTLFVTHDKEEAFQLFERLILLEQGRILQLGSPRTLYEQPLSPDVARFFGSTALLAGSCRDRRFVSKNLAFPLDYPDSESLTLAVPPHAVTVGQAGPDAIRARVASCHYAEGRYKIELANGLALYHDQALDGECQIRLEQSKISIFAGAAC